MQRRHLPTVPEMALGALATLLAPAGCAGDGAARTAAGGLPAAASPMARAAMFEDPSDDLFDPDDDFDPDEDYDFDDELAAELQQQREQEAMEARTSPHLRASLLRMLDELQTQEDPEGGWRLGTEPPSGRQYARIPVRDDVAFGISDGFEVAAWLPVDDDGVPRGDDVYMVKRGGFAGWQFTAGPFPLPAQQSLTLTERDAGRQLAVAADAGLTVRLPAREAPEEGWRAPGGGGLHATEVHLEAMAGGREQVFHYDLRGVEPGLHTLDLFADGEGPGRLFQVLVDVVPSGSDRDGDGDGDLADADEAGW